jgi:hypothetical protein
MSLTRPITLLDAVTADTVGAATGNPGGVFFIVIEGDYGSGTVTLQTSHANVDWQDVYASDGTLLEFNAANDYASELHLSSAMSVRATLAGSTAPDLSVKLA